MAVVVLWLHLATRKSPIRTSGCAQRHNGLRMPPPSWAKPPAEACHTLVRFRPQPRNGPCLGPSACASFPAKLVRLRPPVKPKMGRGEHPRPPARGLGWPGATPAGGVNQRRGGDWGRGAATRAAWAWGGVWTRRADRRPRYERPGGGGGPAGRGRQPVRSSARGDWAPARALSLTALGRRSLFSRVQGTSAWPWGLVTPCQSWIT